MERTPGAWKGHPVHGKDSRCMERTPGAWKRHLVHPVLFVFAQKTDKFWFSANGMRTIPVTSNSFKEELQRNPEEILEIFWGNLENPSRGASKPNPALENRFIFHWLITPQLIKLMINRNGFDQLIPIHTYAHLVRELFDALVYTRLKISLLLQRIQYSSAELWLLEQTQSGEQVGALQLLEIKHVLTPVKRHPTERSSWISKSHEPRSEEHLVLPSENSGEIHNRTQLQYPCQKGLRSHQTNFEQLHL